MFKVKLESGAEHAVEVSNENYAVNGQQVKLDVLSVGENSYHLLLDEKSLFVKLIAFDRNTKSMSFDIEGRKVNLVVEDDYDLLLSKMGMEPGAGLKVSEFKAPMPGLVLDVLVAEGDTVEKDQSLLILEAMKMENALKAPGDGVIAGVEVSKGDKVDKNQILIRFE